MNTTIIIAIVALILAAIAISFGIIALYKANNAENGVDDLYGIADDQIEVIDKIIKMLGIRCENDKRAEIERIKRLAKEIEFDEKGEPIIPEELTKDFTPEQLAKLKSDLKFGKHLAETFAGFMQTVHEHIERENVRPAAEKPANGKKTGKTPKYDDAFKAEVCKYVEEHPEESVNSVARHFSIGKNTVKRWIAKS